MTNKKDGDENDKRRDVKDLLRRGDAWHWKENEMLAHVLTEGDPTTRDALKARLKELQPTYGDGPLEVPEGLVEYLLKRDDAANVKEKATVLAVWSGDKTNAIQAIQAIREAYRAANGIVSSAPLPGEPGYVRADLVLGEMDHLVEKEHAHSQRTMAGEKRDRKHEREIREGPQPAYLKEMVGAETPYQRTFHRTFDALAGDPRFEQIGRNYAKAYIDSRLQGKSPDASAREAASYVEREFKLNLK